MSLINRIPEGEHLYRCEASPIHETMSGPGLPFCETGRCGAPRRDDDDACRMGHAMPAGSTSCDIGMCEAAVREISDEERMLEAFDREWLAFFGELQSFDIEPSERQR